MYRTRLLILLVVTALFGIGLVAVKPMLKDSRRRGTLRAVFDAEFLSRPDGYAGLCDHYGFAFPNAPRQMDPGLMYQAVAEGSADVIDAFATDGRIAAFDLVVLEDDKRFFPPYHAAPLVRGDTLRRYPELEQALNLLSGRLSDDVMQRLNYDADNDGAKPRDIARRFLAETGLLPTGQSTNKKRTGVIRIGGKQFTEQEILGEMMALLVEAHTTLRVERRLNLGGTMLCFQALRSGDIDLYPEYTGTGLVNILKIAAPPDRDMSYRTVKEQFEEQFDLHWLEPFGFNNTYTLTMRRKHAEELGIRSISDLARHVSTEPSEVGQDSMKLMDEW